MDALLSDIRFAIRSLGKSALLLGALRAAFVGTSPADPVVFALVALPLALVAMSAIWLPARRAARIDRSTHFGRSRRNTDTRCTLVGRSRTAR